jgi:hypothetical protein
MGALALLPLLLLGTGNAVRRVLQAACAVLAAAIVAGVRTEPLPLAGEEVGVALAGVESARTAGERLLEAAAHQGLLVGAAALALAAATLPAARRLGPWAGAVWAVLLLAALLVGTPAASPLPTIGAVWATWLVVSFRPTLAGVSRLAERLRETVSERLSGPGRLQPSGVVIRPQRD